MRQRNQDNWLGFIYFVVKSFLILALFGAQDW